MSFQKVFIFSFENIAEIVFIKDLMIGNKDPNFFGVGGAFNFYFENDFKFDYLMILQIMMYLIIKLYLFLRLLK